MSTSNIALRIKLIAEAAVEHILNLKNRLSRRERERELNAMLEERGNDKNKLATVQKLQEEIEKLGFEEG